jgi:hypothetical protein
VRAAVVELHPRSHDQILDCAGHDHFAGTRVTHDASCDVHSNPGDIATQQLHLPGVQSRSRLKNTELADIDVDRLRATNGAPRTVEDRQHAVPGALHQPASVTFDLARSSGVVHLEELSPAAIAHLGGVARRVDEIGEEDHGKRAVGRLGDCTG